MNKELIRLDKLLTGLRRNISQLQLDINRISNRATLEGKMNKDRKNWMVQANAFFNKLLQERRITKEELKIYFKRRGTC